MQFINSVDLEEVAQRADLRIKSSICDCYLRIAQFDVVKEIQNWHLVVFFIFYILIFVFSLARVLSWLGYCPGSGIAQHWDPRQTLHEIPEASRSVVVSASLIKCPLIWDSAMKLNLSINMRVIRNGNNPQSIQFAKFLLNFGENNPTIERIHNTDICH